MRMRVRGLTLVGVASIAALALVGLGLRSFGVAESNGLESPGAEIFAFVIGVWLPLFALIYACVRNRVAVVVLAFCVGLSVNVVFLTHATLVTAEPHARRLFEGPSRPDVPVRIERVTLHEHEGERYERSRLRYG